MGFSEVIRQMRDYMGLNQTHFATRLGVSRQHLWAIEADRLPVSPKRAASFADRLGIETRDFVQAALQSTLDRAGLAFEVNLVEKDRGRARRKTRGCTRTRKTIRRRAGWTERAEA